MIRSLTPIYRVYINHEQMQGVYPQGHFYRENQLSKFACGLSPSPVFYSLYKTIITNIVGDMWETFLTLCTYALYRISYPHPCGQGVEQNRITFRSLWLFAKLSTFAQSP